ncbi:hypothetical protein FRC12_006342 [Ceratobasidium sp. 428]|nr:hypothetical protein FRC12_006342 [Ceratobasidium sp. 428]
MHISSDLPMEPDSEGPSKSMIGTIVGVVVNGVVVLLGFVMFGVSLFRRKHDANEISEVEKNDIESVPKRRSVDTLTTVVEKTEEKVVV